MVNEQLGMEVAAPAAPPPPPVTAIPPVGLDWPQALKDLARENAIRAGLIHPQDDQREEHDR